MIAVQGSIQTRNYEDKNGNKRIAVKIVADSVSFCGGKSESKPTENESFTVFPDEAEPFTAQDDLDGLPF